jgi:hypothetical protein
MCGAMKRHLKHPKKAVKNLADYWHCSVVVDYTSPWEA